MEPTHMARDYTISLESMVICVTEVKQEVTFQRGMAQNIAQMFTAWEVHYPLGRNEYSATYN